MRAFSMLVIVALLPAVHAAPVPPLPALGCGAAPACAWTDGFEAYPAGSNAASGGWAKGLGGVPVVVREKACTGEQSYRLAAYPYRAVSAHRAVSAGPAEFVYVEVCVRVSVVPQGGNAHFGFKQGMSTSSPWVWVMTLSRNGDITMMTSPSTSKVIGQWQTDTEYVLGFGLLPPTPSTPGAVVAWKDGAVVLAEPVLPATVRPIGSAALGMHAEPFAWGGGVAHYDDVRAGAVDLADLPPVPGS